MCLAVKNQKRGNHFMKFFTKIKKASTVILSIAMLASMSTPVLAAEPEPDQSIEIGSTTNDATAVPYSTIHPYKIGPDFVNISCRFGVNGGMFSVIVEDFAPNDYQMDIIMSGRNGTLWQEDDCLHNSSSRAFTCGSEVTNISLRILPRNRLWFPAKEKTFDVKVSW